MKFITDFENEKKILDSPAHFRFFSSLKELKDWRRFLLNCFKDDDVKIDLDVLINLLKIQDRLVKEKDRDARNSLEKRRFVEFQKLKTDIFEFSLAIELLQLQKEISIRELRDKSNKSGLQAFLP